MNIILGNDEETLSQFFMDYPNTSADEIICTRDVQNDVVLTARFTGGELFRQEEVYVDVGLIVRPYDWFVEEIREKACSLSILCETFQSLHKVGTFISDWSEFKVELVSANSHSNEFQILGMSINDCPIPFLQIEKLLNQESRNSLLIPIHHRYSCLLEVLEDKNRHPYYNYHPANIYPKSP